MSTPEKCPKCGAGNGPEGWEFMYDCGSYFGDQKSFNENKGECVRRQRDQLAERVRELETWKESAMAVEREWDPNQLAAMLGGQPGESQRAVIQWKVPILVQRVKQLEAFVTDPHALWSNWLRGDIKLPAGIGDIRECSEKMKRFRSRWLAAHQELQKAEDRIERTEERVKRLEVAGDAMAMAEGCRCDGGIICKRCFERQNAWHAAKGQP